MLGNHWIQYGYAAVAWAVLHCCCAGGHHSSSLAANGHEGVAAPLPAAGARSWTGNPPRCLGPHLYQAAPVASRGGGWSTYIGRRAGQAGGIVKQAGY